MRRGFSLAESILALGLLGTLLVLAVVLLPSCVTLYRNASQQAQAESVGETAFEELRGRPYGSLGGTVDLSHDDYRVQAVVGEEPGCQAAEAKRVLVTVVWSYRGREYRWSGEETFHAPL